MERCWYELDMVGPMEELGKICDGQHSGTSPKISYVPCKDIIPGFLLEKYGSLGIHLGNAMIFYRPSGMSNDYAHIDLQTKTPENSVVSAINIVYKGHGSEMAWYKMPGQNKELRWTTAGTPYLSWPVSELEEMDRARITGKMTLVRVDIPHAIFVKDEPRWCLSLRFSKPFGSWNETVGFFKDLNLLIP